MPDRARQTATRWHEATRGLDRQARDSPNLERTCALGYLPCRLSQSWALFGRGSAERRPSADAGVDGTPLEGGEEFALEWTGVIRIPESGTYTFSLGGDDGSVLRIAGMKVVDNDGLHGYGVKTATLTLAAGAYAFKLGCFEAGGGDRVTFAVERPDMPLPSVPDAWWFRVVDPNRSRGMHP